MRKCDAAGLVGRTRLLICKLVRVIAFLQVGFEQSKHEMLTTFGFNWSSGDQVKFVRCLKHLLYFPKWGGIDMFTQRREGVYKHVFTCIRCYTYKPLSVRTAAFDEFVSAK